MRAQRLAGDVLAADPVAWIRDFDRSRIWPPLHPVLASIPMTAAKLDYRLAVWPSLLGFVATAVFGFLCARRAAGEDSLAATLAGGVAFAWVAASPEHHRFATDVMLESLGAGLTLACLYFLLGWLTPSDEVSRERAARGLGLCLTLLLLEKYNYYLLTLAGVLAAAVTTSTGDERRRWRCALAKRRAFLSRELRHPLVLLGGTLFTAALVVAITGGGSFELFGRRVSARHPFNLAHLGYLAIFLRALFRGWGSARATLARMTPAWRQLVLWHAIPLAVWFALPRRLGYFLHHVSPSNTPDASPGMVERLAAYGSAFSTDYHAEAWGAALALGLAAVAVARLRALTPAGRACVVFVAVAAAGTALHPHFQSRFLMSWVAGVWVIAGLGAHQIASRPGWVPRATAVAIACGVVAYAAAGILAGPPSRTGRAPSVLALTNAYRSATADGRVAILANHPAEELIEWRFVAAGGARERLDVYTPPRRDSRPKREAEFREWLARVSADVVIYVDVSPASPWHVPGFALYEELGEFVEARTDFREAGPPQPAGPGATWQSLRRAR